MQFPPGLSLYTSPELITQHLVGELECGKKVTTSAIVGTYEGKIVTRSGSHYELIDVDSDYEKAFPNAKRRMFDAKNVPPILKKDLPE